MKKKKFTRKDFLKFKKWCEYYIKLFKINDTAIEIRFSEKEDKNWVACSSSTLLYACSISLNKNHHCCYKIDFRSTALHEVLHILMRKLRAVATDRFVKAGDVRKEEEEIVVILEKSLFGRI